MIYKVAGSPYDVILKLIAKSKKDLKQKGNTNDTVTTCYQYVVTHDINLKFIDNSSFPRRRVGWVAA